MILAPSLKSVFVSKSEHSGTVIRMNNVFMLPEVVFFNAEGEVGAVTVILTKLR